MSIFSFKLSYYLELIMKLYAFPLKKNSTRIRKTHFMLITKTLGSLYEKYQSSKCGFFFYLSDVHPSKEKIIK